MMTPKIEGEEAMARKCSCDELKRALEKGTDNEGYLSLFHYTRGRWHVGDWELAAPKYCPWCGNLLPVLEADCGFPS